MPLRDFKCKKCEAVQERYYRFNEDGSLNVSDCFKDDCDGELEMQGLSASISKTAIFPYTCTHVDGKGTPIVIEDIGHLRRLEKQYGVCFTGWNNNDNNPDTPRDLPRHRVGGRDYEG